MIFATHPPATTLARRLLIDAHVHYHRGFGASSFLGAALSNLRDAAERRGFGHDWGGVLVLTDGSGEPGFRQLLDDAPGAGWRVTPRGPRACDLTVDNRLGRHRLTVLSGRQIVTGDNLEVLSLGPGESVPEALPLETTLFELQTTGALAILPWGFGKWWGRRGRHVETLLRHPPEELDLTKVLLGDNGGRPRGSLPPDLFAMAQAIGMGILSGSDPLPFRRQQWRAGSYGSWLELDDHGRDHNGIERSRGDHGPDNIGDPVSLPAVERHDPTPWLIERLTAPGVRLHVFGRKRGFFGFLGDQLRMQWRKQRREQGRKQRRLRMARSRRRETGG